jgi:hypothetical protein
VFEDASWIELIKDTTFCIHDHKHSGFLKGSNFFKDHLLLAFTFLSHRSEEIVSA